MEDTRRMPTAAPVAAPTPAPAMAEPSRPGCSGTCKDRETVDHVELGNVYSMPEKRRGVREPRDSFMLDRKADGIVKSHPCVDMVGRAGVSTDPGPINHGQDKDLEA